MSSRHQSRRRRSYGRREHEVRERRQRGSSAYAGEPVDWVNDDAATAALPVVRAFRSVVSVVPTDDLAHARARRLGAALREVDAA